MSVCPDCGVVTLEATRYCPSCARDNKPMTKHQTSNPYEQQAQYSAPPPRAASKGLDQIFGIDPRIAFLAFVVDLMLFGAAAASLGIDLPVIIPLAIAAR